MTQTFSKTEEAFYFCFFRIFTVKHTNHHHVIIKTSDDEMNRIKSLDGDTYQYCLISAHRIQLSEADLQSMIIRGLIMDGESLLKRFKAQHKKSISTNGHQ